MKKRFEVALLSLAVTVSAFAQTQMFNSCTENEGADIQVTLPSTFNTANTALPDPFLMMDGTRMTSKEQWKQRRQELLKLLERTVYGTKPPKPNSVTGTVSRTSISVNAGGGSFSVAVTMPTGGSAPYPLVIRFDNSGVSAASFTGNGVAVASLTTSAVGGGNRTTKTGGFYNANTTSQKTGHLAAWAWGVSRIIDVIEADPNKLFDPTKIGVTGCSRDGKGAFAAGVLDQRVALTMPMESGTGGMASMRVAYNNRDQSGGTNGSQSPSAAYGEQPWLGDDFSAFQNSPNNLPIDMHEAVALVAPRGFLAVYKTSSSAGQWLNVPGSHVSAVAGAEVYKALGVGGNFGWLNTGTDSHCAWTTSYNNTVKDFIDIFLHRTKAPNAAPLFTENNRPSTTTYINWTTPTLSGQLTIGGCGPAPSGCALTTAVSPLAGGTVSLSPAPPENGLYDSSAVVTAEATAANGWKFDRWVGLTDSTTNPATITMNASKSVTAKFLPTEEGTENLIKNGTFTNTQNWTLNQWDNSAGTFTASGNEGVINITTLPTGMVDHSLQLVQNGVPLDEGITYRLTFEASATQNRTITVYMQMDSDPYTSYMQETVSLTPAKQQYEFVFEMTEKTDPNGRIAFNVGGESPNIRLSNVKLVYTPQVTAGISAKTPITATNNSAKLTVKARSKSALNVNFRAVSGGEAVLRLYTLKGKVISTAKLQTSAGKVYSHTFGASKLPNGFYVVSLHSGASVEQARVIIQK